MPQQFDEIFNCLSELVKWLSFFSCVHRAVPLLGKKSSGIRKSEITQTFCCFLSLTEFFVDFAGITFFVVFCCILLSKILIEYTYWAAPNTILRIRIRSPITVQVPKNLVFCIVWINLYFFSSVQ